MGFSRSKRKGSARIFPRSEMKATSWGITTIPHTGRPKIIPAYLSEGFLLVLKSECRHGFSLEAGRLLMRGANDRLTAAPPFP